MDASERDSGKWTDTQCLLMTFPNSSGGWWLISSVFLIRISCHKTTHANGYYGAWPGWAVSISVLPLTCPQNVTLLFYKQEFFFFFTYTESFKTLFVFGSDRYSLLHGLWWYRAEAILWLQGAGFSLQWFLLLWSMGCRACRLQELWLWALEHSLSSYGTRA